MKMFNYKNLFGIIGCVKILNLYHENFKSNKIPIRRAQDGKGGLCNKCMNLLFTGGSFGLFLANISYIHRVEVLMFFLKYYVILSIV